MDNGFDPNWLPVLAMSATMGWVMLKFDLLRPWCDAAAAVGRWMARAEDISTPEGPEVGASQRASSGQASAFRSASGSMWASRSRQAEELLTSAGLDGLDAPLADIWLCSDPQVRRFMTAVPGYPSDPARVQTFLGYLLSAREEKLPRAQVAPAEQEGVYWRHLTTRLDLALRLAGLKGLECSAAEIMACDSKAVQDLMAGLPIYPRTPEAADLYLETFRVAKRELQAKGEL